jgi:DNA-binding transcriptional LysR family regulator
VVSANTDPVYQKFARALHARNGRPPVLGPTVRTIDEYLEAVLAGQAIGLAPASAARYYSRPGITYVPVPDAQPSICALSWTTRHPTTPAADAMIHLVRQHHPLGTEPTRSDIDRR